MVSSYRAGYWTGETRFYFRKFCSRFLITVDEVKSTFMDAEVTRFSNTAKILDKYVPWKNHLK